MEYERARFFRGELLSNTCGLDNDWNDVHDYDDLHLNIDPVVGITRVVVSERRYIGRDCDLGVGDVAGAYYACGDASLTGYHLV